MNILVTGAAGRIGRAICQNLASDHEVIGLDRQDSDWTHIQADLLDLVRLRQACSGVQAVIHAAALHSPHVGQVTDVEFQRINVDGTKALLDAAAAAGVRRFVFTSTTALFGYASMLSDRAAWITEATEPQPRTIYHTTKLAAEALLRQAAGQGGPEVRMIRMSRCFPEPVNLMTVYRLHRGVDARDVAQAHRLALFDKSEHDTFIISALTPFRPEDCRELKFNPLTVIQRRMPDVAELFEQQNWPPPSSIDRVYDALLAKRELGWRPRYGPSSVMAQWWSGSSEVLAPA